MQRVIMNTAFETFINNISAYPTVFFTALVLFVTLYWLVALLGFVDMDVVDVGDIGDIGDISDIGDIGDAGNASAGLLSGILLKFGLYGVPLVVILTGIALIGWVLSYFYGSFLQAQFGHGVLHYVFGTGALVLVLVVSMWLTGLMLSPIRRHIANIPKRHAQSFLGQTAVVRTLTVNDRHGEAILEDGGAGLIFKVRQLMGDDTIIVQGDNVRLVAYDQQQNIYQIQKINESTD